MGQRMSSLRRALALGDVHGLEKILQEAGEGSADLINEDYTSDCFFCCFRNVQSPLHTAMSYLHSPNDHPKMVEIIVKYGADVNAHNMDHGRAPLHRAGLQCNIWMAQLFIDHGGDIQSEDYEGNRPLHLASQSIPGSQLQNAQVVDLYAKLSSAQDINAQNNKGNTALHLAARSDFSAAVACLLKYGAKPDIVNIDGKLPIQVAGKSSRSVLSEHAASTN